MLNVVIKNMLPVMLHYNIYEESKGDTTLHFSNLVAIHHLFQFCSSHHSVFLYNLPLYLMMVFIFCPVRKKIDLLVYGKIYLWEFCKQRTPQ